MSLFDKQISQQIPGIAVGIGAALITQIVVMGVISLMRPVAKTALKGGFMVSDAASGVYSLATSQVGKLTGKAGGKPQ